MSFANKPNKWVKPTHFRDVSFVADATILTSLQWSAYPERYAYMMKYLSIILLLSSYPVFSEERKGIGESVENDKIQVLACKSEILNKSNKIISECSRAFKMVIQTEQSISGIQDDFNKPHINQDLDDKFRMQIKSTIVAHEKIKEDLYSELQTLSEDEILTIRDKAIEKF